MASPWQAVNSTCLKNRTSLPCRQAFTAQKHHAWYLLSPGFKQHQNKVKSKFPSPRTTCTIKVYCLALTPKLPPTNQHMVHTYTTDKQKTIWRIALQNYCFYLCREGEGREQVKRAFILIVWHFTERVCVHFFSGTFFKTISHSRALRDSMDGRQITNIDINYP